MLRRHFGISAYVAEHILPLWEREMLLRRLGEDLTDQPQDTFAQVPEELMALG